MTEMTLDADTVRRLFDYDPKTGIFRWRVRGAQNTPAGKEAGTIRPRRYRGDDLKYRCVSYKGRRYLVHRLAFLYMTGCWPADQIDHIDGDGLNNAWSNLREATNSQNQANSRSLKRGSVTGFRGVYIRGKKFQARIMVERRNYHLGIFNTAEEAYAAYCEAARRHFGEFARIEDIGK